MFGSVKNSTLNLNNLMATYESPMKGYKNTLSMKDDSPIIRKSPHTFHRGGGDD